MFEKKETYKYFLRPKEKNKSFKSYIYLYIQNKFIKTFFLWFSEF